MALAPRGPCPRYFTDTKNGRSVLLTGTHTWNNLQEMGNPLSSFDYPAYLDFLSAHDMNFIRLWTWENPRWGPWSSEDDYRISPVCYARTGPGTARDGLPRFNLDVWNEEYFERLRDRVEQAERRGIYVGVMLFCGCSIGSRGWPERDTAGLPPKNPWDSHPYNSANNVNGVNGDPEGRGDGWDTRSVGNTAVFERQKTLVQAVSEILAANDNVLFEVGNEDPFDSAEWQYHIIRSLREYEASRGRSRPIGMTASWNQPNDALFKSPADWISPYYNEQEATRPFVSTGDKIIIADSDHVFPNVGITMDFTWKAFLTGVNPISMDHRKQGEAWTYFLGKACSAVREFEREEPGSLQAGSFMSAPGDLAQRAVRQVSRRIRLEGAEVRSALSSTGYCLAEPGRWYVVYQPEAGDFTVDLRGGAFALSWIDPMTGRLSHASDAKGGTAPQGFTPPRTPVVLLLECRENR